jgi:glutaminyl-tRNA synthetase
LFNQESPGKGDGDFMDHINPESLTVVEQAWIEPSLVMAAPEQNFQFEREGYFVADRFDYSADTPVFNKTIGLRDSWNN